MNSLKELWADRQKRALIIIGGYVIFFAVVFAMFLPGARQSVQLNYQEKEQEEEEIVVNPPLIDFLDIDDYEYVLFIKLVDETELELEVAVTEQFLVEINEEKTEVIKTALIFNNMMLNRMITNGDLVARNINYLEQTETEVYFLNSDIFEQLLFEEVNAELIFTFSDENLLTAEIYFYDAFDDIEKIMINYQID